MRTKPMHFNASLPPTATPLDAREVAHIGLAWIIAAAASYFAFSRAKRGSSN
ncbi:MAG: hypothetical protein IH945_07375 [Armatimonadetes bacterium]|nr:hypothetical protein [Armatimonadota bacterium]